VQPVILAVGPSGVGKSYISGVLKQARGFDYWKIYKFAENKLPSAWDGRRELIDIPTLIAAARTRMAATAAPGIVVSLAPESVLELRQLFEARALGATPLVLWGTPDQCVRGTCQQE
jgi:hypothetical protein